MSDIDDGDGFYRVFIFLQSTPEIFANTGRLTATAYASNCGENIGIFGYHFQVLKYDENNLLFSLPFDHFVETDESNTWESIFTPIGRMEGLYVGLRETIVCE